MADPSPPTVVPVTVDTFVRAETDTYLGVLAAGTGLATFGHLRQPAPVERQDVVRMNRDTLYSTCVVDLDAGDVTITLPDAEGRYLSLLVIDQDHYTPGCQYRAGAHVLTRASVGTRYALALVRIFVDPDDPADLAAVHALQDALAVEAADPGRFEVPAWDPASLALIRSTLQRLAPLGLGPGPEALGTRQEVDPLRHLIVTAAGWGGNPSRDARYVPVFPEHNDGRTPYRLRVGEVPVDGFWSISVYDEAGYFVANDEGAYSLNSVTAQADPDGSVTVHFGGPGEGVANHLPVPEGWNYLVRLYRPRAEILDGRWQFPAAEAVPT